MGNMSLFQKRSKFRKHVVNEVYADIKLDSKHNRVSTIREARKTVFNDLYKVTSLNAQCIPDAS